MLWVLVCCLLVVCCWSDTSDCKFTLTSYDDVQITYNLQPFHLTDAVFEVNDTLDRGYTYHFNICDDFPESVYAKFPNNCKHSTNGPCIDDEQTIEAQNGTCYNYLNITENVIPSALQIEFGKWGESCYWMGTELSGKTNYDTDFYDSEQPAKGIIFNIYNGGWCESVSKNRELRVEFICPDSPRTYYDPEGERMIDEPVYEEGTCTYVVSYETALACPAACISDHGESFAVCSGKGICALDPLVKEVRCLCDQGFKGTHCTEIDMQYYAEDSAPHSGLIAAVVICVLLLLVTVVLAAYLCFKLKNKGSQGQGVSSKEYFEPILENNTGSINKSGGNTNNQQTLVGVQPDDDN